MTMVVNGREYLSTLELHIRTGISKYYLRKLARNSRIPAKKVGSRWYYDLDAVISEFMKDNDYSQSANNMCEELEDAATSKRNPLEIDISDLG